MGIRDLIREFFRPAILSSLGSIVGIGSGLNSLFGGSNTGAPQITGGGNSFYTPTGTGSADTSWQQLLAQIMQKQQEVQGYAGGSPAWSFLDEMQTVPYGSLGPAGDRAGAQYGALSGTAGQYANTLGAQGGKEFAAGNDAYNLARDPMNQMHDFLQQQTVDNSRAATSARGVGMSPYAAGAENDATRNFNMDWQSNLLNRANTGINAMTNANRAGATDLAGSLSFGAQAPAFMMQSAETPISAYATGAGMPGQFATQYAQQVAQMMSPSSGLMSSIIPYLNYGQGAMGTAGNFSMAGAGAGNALQTQGLERILGGMQNLTGPGSWLQGFGNSAPDPYGGNLNMYQNQADMGYSMPG